MCESSNDQVLITKTGFDHKVFSDLNNLFSPVFRWYSPWTEDGFVKRLTNPDEGKPRILDSAGCLGLILSWYRTRGTAKKTLCMTFGLTPSHLCVWLRFGKRVLLHVLQNHEDAMPRIPSDTLIADMANSVELKYRTSSLPY